MIYEVVITPDAQKDWDNALSYISLIKKNPQAVINLNNDFEDAVYTLETAAGSLKFDDDPDIAAMGYHRIHLDKHNYFMLYRVIGDQAFVDRIFHDLQDYKNHMYQ